MNHNSRKHKVKVFTWVNGVLVVIHHEFDTYEIAIEFLNNTVYESVKIYNEFDELVYSGNFIEVDLYAYSNGYSY